MISAYVFSYREKVISASVPVGKRKKLIGKKYTKVSRNFSRADHGTIIENGFFLFEPESNFYYVLVK